MGIVVFMAVVADVAKQIHGIPASGVHQMIVNRTGQTYAANLEHVKLQPVCMECVLIQPWEGTFVSVMKVIQD